MLESPPRRKKEALHVTEWEHYIVPDERELGGDRQPLPLFEDSASEPTSSGDDSPSAVFVGRWNRLVSVTNWEKGRIITNWREAMISQGAVATDYSDKAWAKHGGRVTGQHVGRLRRVYQRFGDEHDQYDSLFWSHFHAAVDWDDAEMWLEGAVQNEWSVSQMRAKRWETLGAVDELKPHDDEIVVSELDEDASLVAPVPAEADDETGKPDTTTANTVASQVSDENAERDETSSEESADSPQRDSAPPVEKPQEQRVRPFEDLNALPADVAEAMERFKLAILAHKLAGWADISANQLIDCLDALKELTLAPSE